jgi:hypothetical protein
MGRHHAHHQHGVSLGKYAEWMLERFGVEADAALAITIVTKTYELSSAMENVIFLESAFDIHARLLCCLEYRLRRCVSEGRMLPSKSRRLQDLAQKSGISQARVMAETAEQVLAA